MSTIQDIEKTVWEQIHEATKSHDPARLQHFSSIAREIKESKTEWEAKINGFIGHGSSSHSMFTAPAAPRPSRAASTVEDYTNRAIRGFEFQGQSYPATTYKTLLVTLAELLRKKHGANFDMKVLQFGGRKRSYFSKDRTQLKYAHELTPGGLFIETNLNASLVVRICRDMVRELGYSDAALQLH